MKKDLINSITEMIHTQLRFVFCFTQSNHIRPSYFIFYYKTLVATKIWNTFSSRSNCYIFSARFYVQEVHLISHGYFIF